MEIIIMSLVTAASVAGVSVYSKRQKKKKEEQFRLEKFEMAHFIQKVLNDQIIFRKITTTGIMSQLFQASDDGFCIDVKITKDEIEFLLYSRKKIHRIYSHYVFNRSRKAGQVIKCLEDFSLSNEVLLRQLEKKIVEYAWENPLSFYAKKSFNLWNDFKPKSSATEKPVDKLTTDFQEDVYALEQMYTKIKQTANDHFNIEEKHELERLYYHDFENLKATFSSIPHKTPQNMQMMKDSLFIIENKLQIFYKKADLHHKQSFERTVEIIKNRDK